MAIANKVYYNGKQVSLVAGQTRLTPNSFFTSQVVGVRSYTVPEWATSFSYIAIGGGAAGQHGRGDFGGAGLGGMAGRISYGTVELDAVNRIVTSKVGAGGDSNNQPGEDSWVGYGSRTMFGNGGSGTSTNQAGSYRYLPLNDLDIERFLMRTDTIVRYESSTGGYAYSTAGTGNAGRGIRGGGGAGGNGGIFGNYTRGGSGGDGFIKLVFWGVDPGMVRPATIPLNRTAYGGDTMDIVYGYETDDFGGQLSVNHGGINSHEVGRLGHQYILRNDLSVEVTRGGYYNLRLLHVQETGGREVQATAKRLAFVKNGILRHTKLNTSTFEVLRTELQPGDVIFPTVMLHDDSTGKGSMRMIIDPTI